MLISPRVLAEVPGVSAYHQAFLIGTPFARNSTSDDGFHVGGFFLLQQSPSRISVGLSPRQTTYQPFRSF
jgi:hypothetical protein